MGEGWWDGTESLIWGQLKLHLFVSVLFFFYELVRLNLGAWAVSVFCSPLWRTKKKQLVFQDLFGELLNSHLHNLAMSLQLLQ